MTNFKYTFNSINNFNSFIKEKILIDVIINDMEKIGRSNGLKGFEIVKKIILFVEGFKVENNLATPTLKIKRHELYKKFHNDILNLYKS